VQFAPALGSKNDTERLEKLFELYTQMTTKQPTAKNPARSDRRQKSA